MTGRPRPQSLLRPRGGWLWAKHVSKLMLFSLLALAVRVMAAEVVLKLDPGTVIPGEPSRVEVWVTGYDAASDIGGVEFVLPYDPQQLEIVDGEGNPVATLTPSPAFPFVLVNQVDAKEGVVRYAAGAVDEFVTLPKVLATFYVRSFTVGEHRIGHDRSRSRIAVGLSEGVEKIRAMTLGGEEATLTVEDPRGKSLLREPVYAFPNPAPAGLVTFRHRTRNPSAQVQIRIYTPQGRLVAQVTGKQGGKTRIGETAGLANGVYLYVVEVKDGELSERVMGKVVVLR